MFHMDIPLFSSCEISPQCVNFHSVNILTQYFPFKMRKCVPTPGFGNNPPEFVPFWCFQFYLETGGFGVMIKGRAYPITVSSSAGNAPEVLCTTWLGGQRYLSEKIYLKSAGNAPGTTLSLWKNIFNIWGKRPRGSSVPHGWGDDVILLEINTNAPHRRSLAIRSNRLAPAKTI